jgi:hypothetical protein
VGTRSRRLFAARAEVSHRGCSQPLQRVVTDFGADVAFGQVVGKLREHYGVALAPETIGGIVEGHAQAMFEQQTFEEDWPRAAGEPLVVAQMDGGMVPIVVADPAQVDRRKGKRLEWKEAKLTLAHALGKTALHDGATLQGGVEEAGRWLLQCAHRAGLGVDTLVHALGDGAHWISDQVEQRFGEQGRFTVDFYHVSDYLAAAAKVCSPAPQAWLREQQQHLKCNRLAMVLAALTPHLEPEDMIDAPVRTCHRYLGNRADRLDYQGALAQGLPIGSGEIESAHRYVVQQRLKRPGAWWTLEHAEHMLALRLNRANGLWQQYWDNCANTRQVA